MLLYFFFFNDTATTEIYTLSLHDALPISGIRVVARPGHVRERDLEAPGRSTVRLPRRLAGGPVRPAPPDDRRHPDGGHRPRRARCDPHARRVLLLLSLQRARELLRRPAAEPGALVPLVHGGARPRDGRRVLRHRDRRRDRAVSGAVAHAGGWVARCAARARSADRLGGPAARAGRPGGAARAGRRTEPRTPGPQPRLHPHSRSLPGLLSQIGRASCRERV